jgi:hypothetical protein
VIHSENNNKRWLGHWIITLFAAKCIAPLFSLIFEDWVAQFFIITLAVALLFAFNNDKVNID